MRVYYGTQNTQTHTDAHIVHKKLTSNAWNIQLRPTEPRVCSIQTLLAKQLFNSLLPSCTRIYIHIGALLVSLIAPFWIIQRDWMCRTVSIPMRRLGKKNATCRLKTRNSGSSTTGHDTNRECLSCEMMQNGAAVPGCKRGSSGTFNAIAGMANTTNRKHSPDEHRYGWQSLLELKCAAMRWPNALHRSLSSIQIFIALNALYQSHVARLQEPWLETIPFTFTSSASVSFAQFTVAVIHDKTEAIDVECEASAWHVQVNWNPANVRSENYFRLGVISAALYHPLYRHRRKLMASYPRDIPIWQAPIFLGGSVRCCSCSVNVIACAVKIIWKSKRRLFIQQFQCASSFVSTSSSIWAERFL